MSEKTEQPTPKRLRESREKGDVCKSQDVPSALGVLGLVVLLMMVHEKLFVVLMEMTEIPMQLISRPFEEALPLALAATGTAMLTILGPVLALVMCVALVSNLGQVGFMVSFKAAQPKLENLSPKKWVNKVFSINNMVDFFKNIIKVLVLAFTVWGVMREHLPTLFAMPGSNVYALWEVMGSAVLDLALTTAQVFCVIAAFDFLFQKWHYNKKHMMDKDEVKREYKESEGDPQIKSKRKQLQQEMLAQNTLGNMRKAKVLVTNPTHMAVALDYEPGRTPLPVVLAKGEGHMAQRMIKLAQEEGIPIMRNVPLAHILFENCTEQAYIPKDLIEPVAEVLRWVQSLGR